jgi:hypothetical protein
MLLGLRAQLREDTGFPPSEAIFGAPIVLPNDFLQNEEMLVDAIIKFFSKTSHDPAVSLPRHNSSARLPSELPGYQPLCPPRLGLSGQRHSTPSAALRRPLRRPAPRTPLLHNQSRVPGRDYRLQPPQGLHGSGRHTWQPASPWQTAGFAPRWSCRNQAGLVLRPASFFTFSSGAATRRTRNRFPTRRGGFCTPGTGGAFTGATDEVPVPSMGTAIEVGPLTSSPSGPGPELGWSPVDTCLHPWRWSDQLGVLQ